MTITAAADGSSLGNPGPAGWGWYVDRNTWAAGGWPVGTNNMGELMAVLDLLRQSAHLDEPLHIQCDSQYVINSVTKWMPGWKRNGWVKKDRKPVLNVDLMKAIDEAMQGRTVTFEWVKGHAGHSLNEEADRLANGAATAYQAGSTPDPGPGFGAARAAEPAAQPTPEPAPVEPPAEPDLFALFDEVPEPLSPTEAAIAGERALLDDAVRADPRRVAALLHPEWAEIGRSGRLYSRAEILAEIAPLPEPVTLEVITAQQIDANTVHLVWRASTATAQTLRSSIWVLRTSGAWVQRFHQGTPAAQ